MARTNVSAKQPVIYTHEGAIAAYAHPEQALRRSVMSCLLWEKEFYENGEKIADRILSFIPQVDDVKVSAMAFEARTRMKLRHVPLLLARGLANKRSPLTAETLTSIIQRPDELGEFLALYDPRYADPKQRKKDPLSREVKIGLANAFKKFDAYQLAKYNRPTAIKLRDVLKLVHPKPNSVEQSELWRRLLGGYCEKCWKGTWQHKEADHDFVEATLPIPDTWEVALSTGKDKTGSWERLLSENKLGALALLRNLRNMQQSGVSTSLIESALQRMDVSRVLPYRFIAAARYAPNLEPVLEPAMLKSIASMERLNGKTAILIDHSGSMEQPLSEKSEMTRFDAAAALAAILRELCPVLRLFTFSDRCIEVPPRRGFAMVDAVKHVINPVSTYLGMAVRYVYQQFPECERLVVITDEQSTDRPQPPQGRGYVINVASAQNGIGYSAWTHIDGFSEGVIDFIRAHESETPHE